MRKVAVIGSGGREAAFAARLAQEAAEAGAVQVCPGGDFIPHSTGDGEIPEGTELIVVGPEQPLVDGKADEWRRQFYLVFGPGADGARIEGSKIWMKRLLQQAGVLTARYEPYESPDDIMRVTNFILAMHGNVAIKTDGLAAGKGVKVTSSVDDAMFDLGAKIHGDAFGEAGRKLVVEEALGVGDDTAYELSLMVVTNGRGGWRLLPVARDYKLLNDEPGAPNTGGMGSYSPVNTEGEQVATDLYHQQLADDIVPKVLEAIIRNGIDYRGILYFGLMVTAKGVYVLEINIRSGDPETQVILPRITSSLTDLLLAAAKGETLPEVTVSDSCYVCLVLAAPGYPMKPETGAIVDTSCVLAFPEITIIHAGTKRGEWDLAEVRGGRFLNIVARGNTVAEARRHAYKAAELIRCDGAQIHPGIAADA